MVERLYQVADLILDPAGGKVMATLIHKMDNDGVDKWYRCFSAI